MDCIVWGEKEGEGVNKLDLNRMEKLRRSLEERFLDIFATVV